MIEEDKKLEEIFAGFRPDMGDSSGFMAALSEKLDAVEYVKRMQDLQVRRYKYAVVAAFVAGVVVSAVVFGGIVTMPSDMFMFSVATGRLSVAISGEYVQMFVLALLSAGMIFGIYAVTNSMQDILSLKEMRMRVSAG